MDDKFRIGASAQFVEVHADALAVGFDAERDQPVQQREEQVNQRQEKSK